VILTVTTTILRDRGTDDEREVEVEVEVEYTPGRPGRLSGPPEDCYPAEPGEVRALSAEAEDGLPVDLAALDEDELLQLCEDAAGDNDDDEDRDDDDDDDDRAWED